MTRTELLAFVATAVLTVSTATGVLLAAPAAQGPDKAERLKQLSPLQYEVTQKSGTEPPFRNPYWNNHRDGIYVDVVSGEPLFSSKDKFDSGTGWPSFTRPIENGHIVTRTDHELWETRVEVRSAQADSHLGHVFDDGPPPTGKRFCMNSAALRFIPVADLAAAGYGRFLPLFGLAAPPAPRTDAAAQPARRSP